MARHPMLSAMCLLSCLSYVAGRHHLVRRMIGGTAVWDQCREPFSWTAALKLETRAGPVTYCSAVIVSERYLVTAGRCLDKFNDQFPPGIAVVGEGDLELRDAAEQVIEIDSFKIHKGYNSKNYANNIALIRLSRPIRLNKCVLPARRMQDDPEACRDLDTTCTMVGWGPYAENPSGAPNSRLPRSGRVQVYDDVVSEILSVNDRGEKPVAGSRLADAIVQGVKACTFDWGGMVSCRRNGVDVLRGIVGDHNCRADPQPPVIITDIPTYQIWIDGCIAEWSSCSSWTKN